MGFRFRQSIRLMPGIRLNLSKSGVSASLGKPGATVNIGRRGVRGTVGIPGSGLSYSEMLTSGTAADGGTLAAPAAAGGTGCALLVVGALLIAGIATCSADEDDTSSATVEPAAVVHPMFVTADALNCRAEADRAAAIVEKHKRGEALIPRLQGPEWTEVDASAGSCWVASRYLSPVALEVEAISPASSSSALLALPSTKSRWKAGRPPAVVRPLRVAGDCPCASRQVCTGPRGGRYCITTGGNKRYGV